ncbi:hypothetical protein Tco_1116605 [Tanacetum coccineum]
MAQQQHAADVHPDELCPPNKRYDLMDANKKVDLEHEDKQVSARFYADKKELTPYTGLASDKSFHLPQEPTTIIIHLWPPPSFSDIGGGFPSTSKHKSLKARKLDKLWPGLRALGIRRIDKRRRTRETLLLIVPILRNDESNIPETPVVNITNVVIPVNVNDDDEEITDEVYELKRREKGKLVEETRNSPIPTPIRSPRIHTNLVSSDIEKLQELTDTPHTTSSSSSPHKNQESNSIQFSENLQDVMVETITCLVGENTLRAVVKQVLEQVSYSISVYVAEGLILAEAKGKERPEGYLLKLFAKRGNIQAQIKTHIDNAIANVIPSQVDASVRSYMSGHILHVHPAQSQTSSVPEQQYQLYLAMKDDPQLQQQDIAIWLALQMKFERATVPQTACRTPAVRPRDQDEPHDDAHPEGENSAKRQKTSEYEAYVSGESSSGQDLQEELAPSTSGNQEQDDDFDFWTDSYASDDDEIPSKQVSQDIMEEVSLTIDEAKLRKMADEMLRQRCTSGDEHQYHIDQMKNFLKSDIVWESRKEILVSPHP